MDAPATGIRIIPPLLFLAMFLIAWLLHWLVPLRLGLSPAFQTAGTILSLATLVVAVYLAIAFQRGGSSFNTTKIPKNLITGGLLRFSRNPAYIDLIALGVGIALMFDSLWVLVLMVPAVVILQREVILKEEALLEHQFGEEYRRYKARVRRWL
jgi:protein-S-isoprenylcysteine O-methyltransferase Ste14